MTTGTALIESQALERAAASEVEIARSARNTIRRHATVGGLCALVPIPVVDDLMERRVHRRMLRILAAQRDIELPKRALDALTDQPSSRYGGFGQKVLLWPFRRILRKLVYVLAIRRAAEAASELYHEGWLFARALEAGYLDPNALERASAEDLAHIRSAIVAARDSVELGVTMRLMKSGLSVGRKSLDGFVEKTKRKIEAQGDDEMGISAAEDASEPLAKRIDAGFAQRWDKGPELDAALRSHLAERADKAA